MTTFGQLFRAARRSKKLTQRKVAEVLSVTPSAVSQWENDDAVPEWRRFVPIALLLELELDEISDSIDQTEGRIHRKDLAINPLPKNAPLKSKLKAVQNRNGLPVYATIPSRAAPHDGAFEILEEIVDVVHRPPSLQFREEAFSIYARSSEMAPWRQAGELIVVDVGRPPRTGDYVLVKLKREGGRSLYLLRRYEGESTNTLSVLQYEPDRRETIELSAVESLIRIADWTELMLEI